MKIRPVEVDLFHANRRTDGQTYIAKLIAIFRNFVRTYLRIDKSGWITSKSIHYLSDSQLSIANVANLSAPFTRRSQDPDTAHLYSDTQVHVHWFGCYDADCSMTIGLRVHQVRATDFHISFLVDSCHCVWNYMRQSYGLTYYSLHYTRNRLLVTSHPISQYMLMTANYRTIRLYNIGLQSFAIQMLMYIKLCLRDYGKCLWCVCVCVCVCVCLSVSVMR